MKKLIWEFIKFLWKRDSLSAFTVILWIERYLTPKDKRDTGSYLLRIGESEMEQK